MRLKEIQKPLSPQQARIKSMQNQVKNTQQAIKAARAREKIKVGQEQLRKISVI
jgi:predicted  nucleic acid-binding Zn-ribbon protein